MDIKDAEWTGSKASMGKSDQVTPGIETVEPAHAKDLAEMELSD